MFIGEDLGNWSCQNKLRFFHRFQNLCKPQAFDSVAESLSSDEVWRSVTWFRVAKNTCQNVPIDHWELVSVVSKFLVGAWQCISMASLIRFLRVSSILAMIKEEDKSRVCPVSLRCPLDFSLFYLFIYLFIYYLFIYLIFIYLFLYLFMIFR